MLKVAFIRLSLLWLLLIMILGATLLIAPRLPSKGTLLLTHNVFLNEYDRFEFYDISRGILYGFTPDLRNDVVSVSLAPNGRLIAGTRVHSIGNQYSLNIMNLEGQTINEVTSQSSLELGTWSRDSQYFFYNDTSTGIFIFDTETSSIAQITIANDDLRLHSWSRNSQYIAFVGNDNNTSSFQIWITNMDGDSQHEVIDSAEIITCPIWSPDGEAIAYLKRVSDGNQLHYINLDGTLNNNYPTGTWRTSDCPSWSANGRYITFMAFSSDDYTIDIVLLDVTTGETETVIEVDPTTNIRWWR